MPCRIGMAINVATRVNEHKREGTVPEHATYEILATDLTYEQAQAAENEAVRRTGCVGFPGGRRVEGRVWDVYRIDW